MKDTIVELAIDFWLLHGVQDDSAINEDCGGIGGIDTRRDFVPNKDVDTFLIFMKKLSFSTCGSLKR